MNVYTVHVRTYVYIYIYIYIYSIHEQKPTSSVNIACKIKRMRSGREVVDKVEKGRREGGGKGRDNDRRREGRRNGGRGGGSGGVGEGGRVEEKEGDRRGRTDGRKRIDENVVQIIGVAVKLFRLEYSLAFNMKLKWQFYNINFQFINV